MLGTRKYEEPLKPKKRRSFSTPTAFCALFDLAQIDKSNLSYFQFTFFSNYDSKNKSN